MVTRQLASRGIRDAAVLAAMGEVPRERFVAAGMEAHAYEDCALPIAEGQTISQPYIVALMAEAAALGRESRVLEVGAGSGYAAAVYSRIAARVFAIERIESLAAAARMRLGALGYDNVELMTGDGSRGWPEEAPFDAILVAAGAGEVPPNLKAQLSVGARLVIPVGRHAYGQSLITLTRRAEDAFEEEDLGAVAFVPLIGG